MPDANTAGDQPETDQAKALMAVAQEARLIAMSCILANMSTIYILAKNGLISPDDVELYARNLTHLPELMTRDTNDPAIRNSSMLLVAHLEEQFGELLALAKASARENWTGDAPPK